MRRRPFLRLAAGAAAATAGHFGRSDTAAGPTTARPTDGTASASDAARTAAADADASGDSAPDLSVSGVETDDYVVRLNDLGEDPTGGVTAVADLSDRERAAARAAIAGTHETRDPARWLRAFASGTAFLERAGSYYRLDDTFPTYRVTAETVAGSVTEADVGEIASYAEYERAVTRDGYVTSGLLRIARRDGIELSYVWPSLRRFFERYDAVRYHGEVVSFSVEVTDSGPPYEMSATEVPVSAAVDGSVWNASGAAARSRELVRRAGRATGAYGFDRAPAGLLEDLRAHRYVRLDGTFYTTYVEKRAPVPVSLSAEVGDGRLHLALRNDGDDDGGDSDDRNDGSNGDDGKRLRLSSGPPRPFGVLRCRATDASDRSSGSDPSGASGPSSAPDAPARLLWSDAYAASDRVRTDDRGVESVADVALVTALAPGESVGESYAVPGLRPGEYAVEGSLDVWESGHGASDGSTVRYRVTFAVE